MPNIVQYNATSEITPSDKGIQAAEVAGRRMGQFGNELANDVRDVSEKVQQHLAIMETSELYKTGTELRLNLQQRYDQESALPENRGDPHFGDRFMAEVSPLLDQWGSGAGTMHGKELAATLKSNIRNEIFNHVAAGQSAMDTAHVEDNLNQTINTLGAGLALDPSEANLRRTLDTARTAIQGMTMAIPNVEVRERVASQLTAERLPQLVAKRYQEAAEAIRQQVGQTGDASQSPAYSQYGDDIAKQVGFEYLPPEAQARLEGLRTEAVRQGQEQFRTADAFQRRKEDDAVDAELLKVRTSVYKDDGHGGVTMVPSPADLDALQRISQMPGAGRRQAEIGQLETVLHTATQDIKEGRERTTDQATYMGLFSRVGNTANPLTKADVDKAYGSGMLSVKDYQFLHESASDSKEANPKRTHTMTELNQWLEKIKPIIDKSDIYSGIDTAGAAKYADYAWHAQDVVRRALDMGADPDKIVSVLTDPNRPNGLWNDLQHGGYLTTNKQGLKGVLQAVSPGGGGTLPPVPGAPPPKRAAGESTDAYLKRIGQ